MTPWASTSTASVSNPTDDYHPLSRREYRTLTAYRQEVLMSRRSTPERLHAARRAATVARLIGEGVSPDRAEAQVGAWEAEAARRGLAHDGRYWDAGWEWMASRRP